MKDHQKISLSEAKMKMYFKPTSMKRLQQAIPNRKDSTFFTFSVPLVMTLLAFLIFTLRLSESFCAVSGFIFCQNNEKKILYHALERICDQNLRKLPWQLLGHVSDDFKQF